MVDHKRVDELLDLRKQIESELEETDKKIVAAVGNRLGRDNTLGSAIPGSDSYYMIQSAVSLRVAWDAVERQIAITYHRERHKDFSYGGVIREER